MMQLESLSQALGKLRTVAPQERMALAREHLWQAGLLGSAYLREATEPASRGPKLFTNLTAIGRADLSVARVYEGHVNAMQLIARYGSDRQRHRADATVADDGLLGIWGADDPANPGRLETRGAGQITAGRKTFASGAGVVRLAAIALKTKAGATQLVLVEGDKLANRFDAAWWKPIGMQATNSFAVNLDDLPIEHEDLLGSPNDYHLQPFFGAGAIRFVTAQLGGTLAVWDATKDHLVRAGRQNDPLQAARLGQMLAELEGAYCCVRDAYIRLAHSIAWHQGQGAAADALIADSARIQMEGAAERVIALAVRSVGCSGLMTTHPLAAAICDLTVYLRQPAPDAAAIRLGQGVGEGRYRAAFDVG